MSLPHLVQHLQSIPILRAQHQHLLFAHPDILPVLNRNFLLCWNRNFSFCCDTLEVLLVTTKGQKKMDLPLADPDLDALTHAALTGVTRALASVGRAFVCLDPSLHVIHASYVIDQFLGEGTALRLRGRPIEELLGDDLFGPKGPLRQALLSGEKREGWRATLQFEGAGPRLVSL